MALEPEHQAEETLKAYAKSRRQQAGAPFELHPSTRNMLQAEVAKIQPGFGRNTTGWLARFTRFWPQFAVTGAIAAIAIAGLALWSDSVQKSKSQNLAPSYQLARASENLDEAETTALSSESAAQKDSLARATRAQAGNESEKSPASPLGNASSLSTVSRAKQFGLSQEAEKMETDSSPDGTLRARGLGLRAESVATAPGHAIVESPARLGLLAENTPEPKPLKTPLDSSSKGQSALADGQVSIGKPLDSVVTATDPPTPLASSATRRFGEARYGQAPPINESLKDNNATLPSPAPTRANEPGVSLLVKTEAQSKPATLKNQPTAAAPFPPAEALTSGLGANQQQSLYYFSNTASRQQFGRAPIPTKSKEINRTARTPAILTRFELEQTGNSLRITEPDGSSYVGEILPIPEQTAVVAGAPGSLAADSSRADKASQKGAELSRNRKQTGHESNAMANSDPNAQNNIMFRAAGTNRKLKQPVVIHGTIVLNTNEPAYANYLQNQQAQSTAQNGNQRIILNNVQLPASRIEGQAIVNDGTSVEINAVPVPPQ